MGLGYIETGEICHMDRTGEPFRSDPCWRESHYFNMTDPGTGISMITTIGMVPNKRRTSGFILLSKGSRTLLLRPLGIYGNPIPSDREVHAGRLAYSIEGNQWKIGYRSRRVDIELVFSPLNRIYPYAAAGEGPIECVATQHYEQAGTFRGKVRLGGSAYGISPCFGHRDHSWGIRDWGGIESYILLSCTFSESSAVNIWKGRVNARTFIKGYVFDGKMNIPIGSAHIDPFITSDGRIVSCSFEFTDPEGHTRYLGARVISDHVFPPHGSLVHETVSEVTMEGERGYGLLELLKHSSPIRRLGAALGLFRRMGVAECRS